MPCPPLNYSDPTLTYRFHSYDLVGLAGIGPTIAVALAKGNFGKALADAVDGLSGHALEIWLQDWRTDIRHELTTNERGLLPRKAAAAAKSIPDSWPDITTLKRYYDPVTSRTAKYAGFEKDHTWSGEINIGSLVQIMDELFEYLHIEILQKCVLYSHTTTMPLKREFPDCAP